MKKVILPAVILLQMFLCGILFSQVIVQPNHSDGIYKSGETVRWTIEVTDINKVDSLHYKILPGGLNVIKEELLKLDGNKAIITYTLKTPGSVLLKVGWKNRENEIKYSNGGAIADVKKIALSGQKPNDFDAFWKEKIEELNTIPINTKLEKAACEAEAIDYYKITMDNIRGTKIQGQLTRPSKGEKLPALLIVQWAGVYPLEQNWATNYASEGWLVLNINAHDLPIDKKKKYYEDLCKGDLKDYWAIGNEDRDSSYFLRMYLSCYRAAQYLENREDWNGETLVVMGTSQGGLQALMTAGLYPGITACTALVPAGFDLFGPEINRKGGWPQWYYCIQGKDPEKVRNTGRYYDVANFVPNIKCPVFVGVGLIDETCPPEGIIAGLNQLKRHKEIMILVHSEHQDKNGSQKPYSDRRDKIWLPAMKIGDKPGK